MGARLRAGAEGVPGLLASRQKRSGPDEPAGADHARADVLALMARAGDETDGPCAILEVVIRHDTPSVRPDDVLAGLRSRGGLQIEQTPVATRSAQGPLDQSTGMVGDPLAIDRDAS